MIKRTTNKKESVVIDSKIEINYSLTGDLLLGVELWSNGISYLIKEPPSECNR